MYLNQSITILNLLTNYKSLCDLDNLRIFYLIKILKLLKQLYFLDIL